MTSTCYFLFDKARLPAREFEIIPVNRLLVKKTRVALHAIHGLVRQAIDQKPKTKPPVVHAFTWQACKF